MKLQELRRICRKRLTDASAARPEYSADLIISKQTGVDRSAVLYNNDEIPSCVCGRVFSLIEKRALGCPLSYVLHEAEFLGYAIKVGRGVLIPRPETELLVEAALRYFPPGRSARFADWCTGSGCIAVALLMENSSLEGIGVDCSAQALRWAGINRKMYRLERRLELMRCAEPAEAPIPPLSLDFIISNPPYIPEDELDGLMSEVKDYEPAVALDGGVGGLKLYRKFFEAFPEFLKSGGLFLAETSGSAGQICSLERLASSEFVLVNKILDYNGIVRHIIWRKR